MSQKDLSKITSAADPGEAQKNMDGTYEGREPAENDMMSRLPQSSMPTGQDPQPFTLKPTTPGQQ